jgi:hypothetical protein
MERKGVAGEKWNWWINPSNHCGLGRYPILAIASRSNCILACHRCGDFYPENALLCQ